MRLEFFDWTGKPITKERKILKYINVEIDKKFDHYMIKEIYEQPLVSKILLDSLETEQNDKVDKFLEEIQNSSKIVFIAAGSSYHSSLIGAYLLRKLGFEAYSVLASEFKDWINCNPNTLVIAVSQSGETMDVILALNEIRNKVRKIFSIVNVPYSTVQRISDESLEIKAGFEKCVAATKTYTNQVLLFMYLAKKLGLKIRINKIPLEIRKTIEGNEDKIRSIAKEWRDERDIYILGRGINYFASLEIALKLKEISYIHAEALPAGELKHGTLALIEHGTKILALNPSWDKDIKTNIEEVKARGGIVLEIPKNFDISEKFPEFTLYSVIIGQLLTYYIARERGLPIDKPRNLAKSVTVK